MLKRNTAFFHPYEGIRIAEIQSSNTFVGNILDGWAWVAGADNPADWCTKPSQVEELYEGGFWESGPDFLRLDESCWPIKRTYKKDDLEGMLDIPKPVHCAFAQVHFHDKYIRRIVIRCGSWRKMVRVLACSCVQDHIRCSAI